MITLDNFKTDFVTSTDGAKIGYRKIGSGPGVILVHGGLQSSLNFTDLAKALADNFTVYIPDRRGRGLSDAYGENDNPGSEVNDIQALIRHTNSHFIFGLSSGAIISLQTTLIEPSITKVALFEPPIPVNGKSFKKLHTDYENALSKGNLGKAFIAIMKGTGGASFLSILPGFITAPMMNMMMRSQMKDIDKNELPLQELVPTFRHDLMISKASESLIEKVKNINAKVLLLGGSKSQKILKEALDKLNESMPDAKRFEFEKEGHLAADNSGSPKEVANELMIFFKQ